MLRQDLDGDGAIEPRVGRAVDFAHAAGADQRPQSIRPQHLPWRDSVADGCRRKSGAERFRLVVRGEQRLDFLAQRPVVGARICNERGAEFGR